MRRALLACLLLAACGRPLTPHELAFIEDLQGGQLNPAHVRISDGLASGPPITIAAPPRVTCQQRIYPPPAGPTVQTGTAAMTIFQTVYVHPQLYRDDFLADWPRRIDLPDAMLIAHEMVHVWQWQHRDETHYFPLKAAMEHVQSQDPYLFDPNTHADFLSLGYEQQGAIMEEYVCCRTLAPEAARTKRLHDMLAKVFGLPPLSRPLAQEALLPWRGVQIAGICD
ncbi:MAG: hypothetical protein GC146_04040 [Limimaricola sp.]|uniref:hypothetical protein n=1 Tax=Limimaricola sp. TaxID=2211665 RepID=UPI001DEE802A|nr:hypothetical protein [Limimaricola sp.]MBI1416372.1 hypothetical protein [Limimaricola sp.]